MRKVYESLKEVVQGTLQLSKVNANPFARLKGTSAQTLNGEMEEIEKVIADTLARLKAAVKEGEAIVAEETEHAEQVITSLRANIAALEDKLRETEDNFRESELASQRMEASVTSKMQDLQGEIKKKEKSLESRGQEAKELKSKVDTLERQVQQAKEKAASEAKRVEHLTETFKAKIAALAAQLEKTEETVRRKDSTIKTLEETLTGKIQDLGSQVKSKEKLLAEREKQVNDLSSQVQVLTKGIKDMSSFFRQAEALAALETQDVGAVLQAGGSKNEQDQTATSQIDSPKVMSSKIETAQETVAPEFFDRVTHELTQVMGPTASMIIRDHVEAIGESMEKFPQVRVTELLESVSEQITDKNKKNSFRERLGQSPTPIQAPVYEEGSYCKFSIKTRNIDRSIMPNGIYTVVYKNSAFTILEGYDIAIINKLTPLVPSSQHQQWFKFPLQIGQTWNYEDRNEQGRIRKNVVTVEKPEPIPNSAGILPSIKLIHTGRAMAGRGSSEVIYHYSEKTGCVTKATTKGIAGTAIEVELIEYGKRQPRSANIIPKFQSMTLAGRRKWRHIVPRQTN